MKHLQQLLIAITITSQALAGELTGSHVGKSGKESFELVFQEIEKREDSYFALVIQGSFGWGSSPNKAAIYLVDPLVNNKGSYTMTPINVTTDGSVGVRNPDPSLLLSVGEKGKKGASFQITNANSSNTEGFGGGIKVKGDDTSRLTWTELVAGPYKGAAGASLDAKAEDRNFEAVVSLEEINGLSGNFKLQQKQPKIYALRAIAVKATGVETERQPRKVVVFISYKDKPYALTMDPAALELVSLEKKK
jgi:hypothetical protein